MTVRSPTESEYKEWIFSPVTQYLMQVLRAKREQMRQDWEGGSFTDYEKEAVVLVNVGNIGLCRGYSYVTDLTYESLIAETEDEPKSVRVETPGSSGVD